MKAKDHIRSISTTASRKMINTSYELASAMRAVKDFTREQAIASKNCRSVASSDCRKKKQN